MVREIRAACAGRRVRALEPAPRPLPAGLAARPAGRQLAGRRGPGRRVARVRRHRLALVRPGRVGQRPADRRGSSAQLSIAVRRAPPAGRREAFARPPSDGATGARSPPRTSPRCCSETDRRRAGLARRLPGRRRPQEPAVVRARRRRRQRGLRPGAAGVASGSGTRDGSRSVRPRPGVRSAEQRRLSYLPAGHAQGYARLLRRLRRRHLRRHPRRAARGPAHLRRRRQVRPDRRRRHPFGPRVRMDVGRPGRVPDPLIRNGVRVRWR